MCFICKFLFPVENFFLYFSLSSLFLELLGRYWTFWTDTHKSLFPLFFYLFYFCCTFWMVSPTLYLNCHHFFSLKAFSWMVTFYNILQFSCGCSFIMKIKLLWFFFSPQIFAAVCIHCLLLFWVPFHSPWLWGFKVYNGGFLWMSGAFSLFCSYLSKRLKRGGITTQKNYIQKRS